jgi:hypothetical protein
MLHIFRHSEPELHDIDQYRSQWMRMSGSNNAELMNWCEENDDNLSPAVHPISASQLLLSDFSDFSSCQSVRPQAASNGET